MALPLFEPLQSMQKIFFVRLIAAGLLLSGLPPVIAADIVETAATSGSFKKFVAALKAAGLSETLKSAGPFTVFAPTDEAFSKLPPETWSAIAKDKEKLNQVLAYHIVPGKMLVSEVKPGKMPTAQGLPLTLKSDNGKVTVNGANVTESDVKADNGVIHAIDAIVMPPEAASDPQSGN